MGDISFQYWYWCLFEIPARRYTQDQKNKHISCIVNGKMSLKTASRKASMRVTAARKYYHKHFNDQNPAPSHITFQSRYIQEQIKQAISYIIDEKMSIAAALRKVKMDQRMAGIYYRQYSKDHNMEIPVSKCRKRYTQDEIKQFIRYIVDDKMNVKAASENADISYASGRNITAST